MSFMERVSTFFGLEDEEYAGNEQREQTQKVAAKTVQQNRTAKKSAPSQKKSSTSQASNARASVRKPMYEKAQPEKQSLQNTRMTENKRPNEQRVRRQTPTPNRSENNVVEMKANQPKQTQQHQSGKIMIIEPRAYAEAMTVAKYVIGGQSVLVNFRLIEETQARRIVDFLTGTVYAEDGDIKRVADEIFLCTPKEVEIDGTAQSLVESNLFDL